MKPIPLAAAAALIVLFAPSAVAQCRPIWLPGGPSMNGPTASALAAWNRGGATVLVVAGNTGAIAPSTGVAAWNGQVWEGLDAKVPDGSVDALLADGDALYIGGSFLTLAGIQGQAGFVGRLDSSGWSGFPNYLTPVKALAMYQGSLVAGGLAITWLQPMPARWTGAGWEALGNGVDGEVRSMVEFEGDLIVGGEFLNAGGQAASRIARWDGQAWHPMGAGFDHPVRQVVVHDGTLYASGLFSFSGGTVVNKIAAWNGIAWEPVGTPPARATSLLSDASGLLATFEAAAGVPNVPIHRWTGSAWEPVTTNPPGSDGNTVNAFGPMALYEGDLLAHGRGLVAWNGTAWELLGDQSRTLAATVTSMVEFEGRVVIAGDMDARGFTAGLPADQSIVAWDGSRFEMFSAVPPPGPTQVLLDAPQGLLAIGQFAWSPTSRTPAALWDGQTWQPHGAALPPFPYVFSGAAISNGRLYVIDNPVGVSALAGGIADITGPTLQSLGTIDLTEPRGIVEHAGEIVVVAEQADFGMPGGLHQDAVIAWDGQSWRVLGDVSIFEGHPSTLASHNGLLIVGGEFDVPQGRNISAWNGTQWQPLGEGLPSAPRQLAVIGGTLHAVGITFDCGTPGLPCRGFATWDGALWTIVRADNASFPMRVAGHGDELFFTGSFSKAVSGFTQGAFARYGVPDPRPCPADLTAGAIPGQPGYGQPSGTLTNDDFFYYLQQFAAGNVAAADLTSTALPSDPCYGRPNGVLNNDDFFYFLAAFAAGC